MQNVQIVSRWSFVSWLQVLDDGRTDIGGHLRAVRPVIGRHIDSTHVPTRAQDTAHSIIQCRCSFVWAFCSICFVAVPVIGAAAGAGNGTPRRAAPHRTGPRLKRGPQHLRNGPIASEGGASRNSARNSCVNYRADRRACKQTSSILTVSCPRRRPGLRDPN